MAKCDSCGLPLEIAVIDKSENYCKQCWYENNPPLLMLAKTWYCDNKLFYQKYNRYINTSINVLKGCGFTLFGERLFFSQQVSKHKKVYILKYRGVLKCPIFRDYTHWPEGMGHCTMINCELR